MSIQKTDKYCIIGAGASGLAAAKNLKQNKIPFEIIEKEGDLGGLWNYQNPGNSIYRSTHLISSKPMTEFSDFPLPDEFPDYPHHSQVMDYFRAFTQHFNLKKYIRFNTEVRSVVPDGDKWQITLNSGKKQLYSGIIIANGHLHEPKYPDYPGKFSGQTIHSKEYKTPDILTDKRVLVIGAGNSGCDIAVESAAHARATFHSMRRGYHFIPKYMFGKPADQIGETSLKLRLPLFLRRAINGFLINLLHGKPQDFGLTAPDHKLFETHPIVNSQMFYALGHGDLTPKPDVKEFKGDRVTFVDDTEEHIDLMVFATGYHITFPFIEKKYLNWHKGAPNLFMHIFHPQYDNLFCAGLIQPDSGQWGLVDYQTQLIARFIRARKFNEKSADRFARIKAKAQVPGQNRIKYIRSSRHFLEVEHFSYRHNLKKMIKLF